MLAQLDTVQVVRPQLHLHRALSFLVSNDVSEHVLYHLLRPGHTGPSFSTPPSTRPAWRRARARSYLEATVTLQVSLLQVARRAFVASQFACSSLWHSTSSCAQRPFRCPQRHLAPHLAICEAVYTPAIEHISAEKLKKKQRKHTWRTKLTRVADPLDKPPTGLEPIRFSQVTRLF